MQISSGLSVTEKPLASSDFCAMIGKIGQYTDQGLVWEYLPPLFHVSWLLPSAIKYSDRVDLLALPHRGRPFLFPGVSSTDAMVYIEKES